MRNRIICIYFFSSFLLCSCNSKQGNNEKKEHKPHVADTAEINRFIRNFIPGKYPFKTDGLNYNSGKDSAAVFTGNSLLSKNSFGFLNDINIALPDSFNPGIYFRYKDTYLCMIRRFSSTFHDSHGTKLSGLPLFNSMLIAIRKDAEPDVLYNITFQSPGQVYKRCWIECPGDDGAPVVIFRRYTAEGETEGEPGDPEVYKIINGRFKAVNDVKIDTAAYKF